MWVMKETQELAVQLFRTVQHTVQQIYLRVLGQHPQSLPLCAFSLLERWAVEETQKDTIAVETVTKHKCATI